MDMLKNVQAVAKSRRNPLAQSPFGEFAVLGALLIGLQHGYAVFTEADSPATIAAATATIAAPALPESPPQIIQSSGKLDSKIDRINDAQWAAHRLANAANKMMIALTPDAVPARVAVASTKTPIAAAKKYQFNYSLKQPKFKAFTNNPFEVDHTQESKVAIWQINKKFSLAATRKIVIMLDPGHGGSDPGSIGHNGLQEKALTLDIAKRAERLLSKNDGLSVLLTRDSDTGMSRKNRVQRVKRSNADMVVSLHLNHLPQTEINLVETFYAAPRNILESIEKQRSEKNANGMVKTTASHNRDLSFTQGSKRLASLMQRRVFEEVIDSNPNTDNAGVKEDTLYILTRSFTPGVLIELSCLSNVQEAERLNDPAYRQRLAQALANGINDYLSTPAAKRQFGPEV